ncbi:MAG: efflux RND transporter periplasmic adaptor subunit [Myxococcales bacterium]|nr:efflux RND transporter periplasmic adaptor subunit [Myxococcales bacterium]
MSTSPEQLQSAPNRMVPLVIGGAVAAVLALGGLLLARSLAATNKVALSADPKGVTAVPARATTYRASRKYVATLEPWLVAKVGPQLVSAYVDTVLVRPGVKVKRGEILATLDCRNASVATQVVASQARALEARQRATAGETARLQGLLAGGFVSQNELEQKQAQAAAESSQIAAINAQVAGRSLEVNDCVLRAPFDGEVAVRSADPGTFARPGASLVTVVDRHLVRLVGDVPETDSEGVEPGTPVQVRFLSNGTTRAGFIARRSPAADPSTRTVRFEVDFAELERAIPVGTTAEISLEIGATTDVSEISLSSAKVRNGKANVFVVEGDAARAMSVPVVGEREGSLFVTRDLPPGALVVTQGRAGLSNGDKVAAKTEAPPSTPAPTPTAPAAGNPGATPGSSGAPDGGKR